MELWEQKKYDLSNTDYAKLIELKLAYEMGYVKASVVKNQKAPLLIGQTILGRLVSIEIDNKNKKLIIRK